MKAEVCYFSAIQSENYICGGHGRSLVVASVKSPDGFLQEDVPRATRRQCGSRITFASLGARFCRKALQSSQRQEGKSSSISSDPFLSLAVYSKDTGVPLTNRVPNRQTLSPGNPTRGQLVRSRTVVRRAWLSSCSKNSSLPSLLRGGWKEKQNKPDGRTSTARKRKVKGLACRPHFSIGRTCAAVSGGEDRVVMQEVPHLTTTPSPKVEEGYIYHPFVDFAVQQLSSSPDVTPLPVKQEFRNMIAQDVTANIDNLAFTSPKIRMFRIASINTGSSMQILNVAGFARPEYDLPIFCADFFSVPNKNIIVLDLNPLHNTDSDKAYKEHYYTDLIPLANKHGELLPWGDKLTAESLQFFSPLVLWTKVGRKDLPRFLFPAFQDYLKAWLRMVDSAHPAVDAVAIARNQEAQHRYISWRVTKDPGRPLLRRLYGEQLSERYINEFLFNGQSALGSKSFLDYFPEYRNADGSMNKQRSMIGKSFERRPWDKNGNFSPN